MANDHNERRAIENMTKRLKEHAEKSGKDQSYETHRKEAVKIALEHDRRKGGAK